MKKQIKKELLERAQKKLEVAQLSYQTSKELTNSEEMKSDDKYDTRAIEAGYLASAQKQRVDELEKDIELLESIEFHGGKEISIGSLVLMEFNQKEQWYFLSSALGGELLTIEGKVILVLSAFSPLGQEMINLSEGESFELETPKELRVYKIKNVQ